MILSFLSPITPTSTLRQAIPASYLTVHVRGSFNVNVYIDVNGQWVSGDRGNEVEWDLQQQTFKGGKGLKTFTVKRRTEQLLTEVNDRSEWGTLHFTAPIVSSEPLLIPGNHGQRRDFVGCQSRSRDFFSATPAIFKDIYLAK